LKEQKRLCFSANPKVTRIILKKHSSGVSTGVHEEVLASRPGIGPTTMHSNQNRDLPHPDLNLSGSKYILVDEGLRIIAVLLTLSSRVLLEKLTVAQLVKKFATIYGTRRLIAVFTRARH
jgi:hypothetical protein